MAAQRKTNTSVTLDVSIIRDAKRLAKQEHRSFSSFVEHSLWLRIQESHIREDGARATATKPAPAPAAKAKPAAPAPVKAAAKTAAKTAAKKSARRK